MYDKIVKLLNEAESCDEINKNANYMINQNSYNDFTRIQLRLIAEWSAGDAIKKRREIRECLKEFEAEYRKCLEFCNERGFKLYSQKTEGLAIPEGEENE